MVETAGGIDLRGLGLTLLILLLAAGAGFLIGFWIGS